MKKVLITRLSQDVSMQSPAQIEALTEYLRVTFSPTFEVSFEIEQINEEDRAAQLLQHLREEFKAHDQAPAIRVEAQGKILEFPTQSEESDDQL